MRILAFDIGGTKIASAVVSVCGKLLSPVVSAPTPKDAGKIEEYIKKTELKTAKLFETALCGGIELVAPHLEKLNSYPRHLGRGQGEGLKINTSDFARNFGIAFQIRDDLINAKTTQNDIKDGIYTAPVIFAGSAENFSSGIEKTQVLLNNYVDSAQKQIDLLRECEYKSALTKLLGLIRDE